MEILKKSVVPELMMLFMVIERFKDADAVYSRYREQGRMLPEGLTYIDSWVEPSLERCFQVMEAPNLDLVKEWTRKWEDLVEFEVITVVKSADARQRVLDEASTP
jgi:hypothetical protein